MKELENKKRDVIELKAEVPMKSEQVLIGRRIKKPNHTCYEYNTLTKELKEAQYEKQDVLFSDNKKISYSMKIIVKENCRYIFALNKKNALKKLKSAI